MKKTRPEAFYAYWRDMDKPQKLALSAAAATSYNYLSQVANGNRKAGESVISRLVKSDKNITHEMLRPDLYEPVSDVA